MEGRIVVTVLGSDNIGIVAKVSEALAEMKVNIIDLNQTIFEDSIFAMILLADLSQTDKNMDEINKQMSNIEKKMKVKIYVQHEDLFKRMHRI